jgi:hypothetical protein
MGVRCADPKRCDDQTGHARVELERICSVLDRTGAERTEGRGRSSHTHFQIEGPSCQTEPPSCHAHLTLLLNVVLLPPLSIFSCPYPFVGLRALDVKPSRQAVACALPSGRTLFFLPFLVLHYLSHSHDPTALQGEEAECEDPQERSPAAHGEGVVGSANRFPDAVTRHIKKWMLLRGMRQKGLVHFGALLGFRPLTMRSCFALFAALTNVT